MKRLGLVLILVMACLAAPAAAAQKAPQIRVLSNRADLVSSGDVLVAIRGAKPKGLKITLGERGVRKRFARRADGSFAGLLTGLRDGANVLRVQPRKGRGARLTITNHPVGGPVFSGPQIQPWVCTNGSKDPQCNAPATYAYKYKSSVDGRLHPYDPANPPSDVATTTTQTGARVPFIVRIETGYQARDQYQIAVLFQPGKPWKAWKPQPQFNHKLLITHGASCGIERRSGTAPSVTEDTAGAGNSPTEALGMGFAVMSTALNNAGHNCNVVTQAESLVMAKERVIERYGKLRYTIGTGCSGGSLAQQQVGNAYPGIYQGILPQCSFPDAWSTGQQLAAYHLDRAYFENPAKWGLGVVWTPDQIAAVEGHPNHVNAIVFDSIYWTDLADPADGCAGVADDAVYDAKTNPGGVRCTLHDYMINVLGPRPREIWTAAEKAAGRGFAGLPISDVGVQFGLVPLTKGQITPAQFVDLNVKIGGADIDLQPTAERSDATQPALRNAYRSGAINTGNNLDRMAIIDLRGPDPGLFHDAYRTFAIRARLEREQGGFPRNHVIWYGQVPLIGDPSYTTEGLKAMDRWLGAVARDKRDVPRARKVADNRPADLVDRCSQLPGVELIDVPGVGKACELDAVQTRYGTPATAAGESIATDTNRCVLKPLRRADYYPIAFTGAQWAQLEKVFPGGVCDWSKPGVSQGDTVPWLTYQDKRGRVIYGGRKLGPAPKSRAMKRRR